MQERFRSASRFNQAIGTWNQQRSRRCNIYVLFDLQLRPGHRIVNTAAVRPRRRCLSRPPLSTRSSTPGTPQRTRLGTGCFAGPPASSRQRSRRCKLCFARPPDFACPPL
jgi:hypothetical protein